MKQQGKDNIKLYLMSVSATNSKLLTALYNLHKVVINDVETATMIEEIIYSLDRIPRLRQHIREKYQLSIFRNE